MSFDQIATVSSTGFKSPAGVHLEPFSKTSAAEMAEEMRSGHLRMKTDDYASVGGDGGRTCGSSVWPPGSSPTTPSWSLAGWVPAPPFSSSSLPSPPCRYSSISFLYYPQTLFLLLCDRFLSVIYPRPARWSRLSFILLAFCGFTVAFVVSDSDSEHYDLFFVLCNRGPF